MTFLVIVAALIFVRLGGPVKVFHNDQWYGSFSASLLKSLGEKSATLTLLLSLFLPVLLVLLLSRELTGIWGFLLSLIVFLYALGRGDLQEQINQYQSALEREDLQAAFHDQAVFNTAHQESDASTWKELHDQAVESIAYRYFEHFFVVIFWFMLAGPAGALLYRLIRLRLDMQLDNGSNNLQVERWLWLVEWLPVRLFGVSLALVGDFSGCIKPWLDSLLSFKGTSAQTLREYAIGALRLEEGGRLKCAEVYALKRLFYRSLVCAVTFIALWIIFV